MRTRPDLESSLLGFRPCHSAKRAIMSHMTLQSGTWDIFWYQINQGMAFVFVPLTTFTMDPIPKAETGYATSLYSVMRNIGSSMGISFVTTCVARRSQFHQNILSSHISASSLASQQVLGHIAHFMQQRGFDSVTAGQKAMPCFTRCFNSKRPC